MTHARNTRAFAALQARAGRYAGRVARLWPAPYENYMALPSARRHLAHLYMSRIDRAPGLSPRAFVREIEALPVRHFLARWAPGAPLGLERALGKLGEDAWAPSDYARLLALLKAGGGAAKTLRHAQEISFDVVARLENLPERLRGPRTARWVSTGWEGQLVREAVKLSERLGGPERADVLVRRLERAKSRRRFFEMLVDDLRPVELAAPVAETVTLRPLRTVAEVKDAGRRFRNCLSDCVHRAIFGASAFVEWRGEEPAVMELEREGVAGWRLVTLLGVQNANVSARTSKLVGEALAAQGVRTGFGAEFLLSEIDEIVETEVDDEVGDALRAAPA
ncbi:MAG: hypothetical protein PVI23_08675 [Maricaulaceae bacterium]|jgi:hypothetical protein